MKKENQPPEIQFQGFWCAALCHWLYLQTAQTLSNFFLFWFQWEPITAQTFNHVTKVYGAHWMMYRKLSSWTGLRSERLKLAVQTYILTENKKRSFKIEIEEDLLKLSRNEKQFKRLKHGVFEPFEKHLLRLEQNESFSNRVINEEFALF